MWYRASLNRVRQGGDRSARIQHAQLRAAALKVLEQLVAPGTPCALIDFPLHRNVGDSAIWLGERALLQQSRVSIEYVCDHESFLERDLADRLPSGTILIQGGGNLGDLWPTSQHFRERIIAGFPGHRIIQLPQSIHFGDGANLDRARAVFDAHPNFTLMTRDNQSLELAKEHFRAPSVLCPDMAFGLEHLPATPLPDYDIVWLSRDDHEAMPHPHRHRNPNVYEVDWSAGQEADRSWQAREQFVRRERRAILTSVARRPASRLLHDRALWRAYDELAGLQLVRGCRLLGRGRVIITDRLHGQILSALLGLPHVVLGDRNRKIRNYWDTWTAGWDLGRWAESPEQAIELADMTLRTMSLYPPDQSEGTPHA
ncbi:MAG TPA: polysaccharide pyruvyl transferase family protein [Pseudonocardiaceae bacterium]|nr:polysaccharide pyruvyl transferase family protein [Pseudonocardiaceae bacterium]